MGYAESVELQLGSGSGLVLQCSRGRETAETPSPSYMEL